MEAGVYSQGKLDRQGLSWKNLLDEAAQHYNEFVLLWDWSADRDQTPESHKLMLEPVTKAQTSKAFISLRRIYDDMADRHTLHEVLESHPEKLLNENAQLYRDLIELSCDHWDSYMWLRSLFENMTWCMLMMDALSKGTQSIGSSRTSSDRLRFDALGLIRWLKFSDIPKRLIDFPQFSSNQRHLDIAAHLPLLNQLFPFEGSWEQTSLNGRMIVGALIAATDFKVKDPQSMFDLILVPGPQAQLSFDVTEGALALLFAATEQDFSIVNLRKTFSSQVLVTHKDHMRHALGCAFELSVDRPKTAYNILDFACYLENFRWATEDPWWWRFLPSILNDRRGAMMVLMAYSDLYESAAAHFEQTCARFKNKLHCPYESRDSHSSLMIRTFSGLLSKYLSQYDKIFAHQMPELSDRLTVFENLRRKASVMKEIASKYLRQSDRWYLLNVDLDNILAVISLNDEGRADRQIDWPEEVTQNLDRFDDSSDPDYWAHDVNLRTYFE